jgi:hypothetical protein
MSFADVMKRWEKWCKQGMHWPFVHDPVRKKPSVTLMFFYLGFFTAFGSVSVSSIILLISKEYMKATIMPMMLLYSCFIFYRLRRLDSVKINLEEKSLDLSGSSEEK